MIKLVGMLLGLGFAIFVMPKMAKNSIAAKYHKSGVAFAEESRLPALGSARFRADSCNFKSTRAAHSGKLAKINCRNIQASN